MIDAVKTVALKILSVFPDSPFSEYIDKFSDLPFLAYLNWFFPVGDCLIALGVFLAALSGYYAYCFVARIFKIIK